MEEEVRIRGERPRALIHDPLALAEVSDAAVIARSWVEPVLQHRWLDIARVLLVHHGSWRGWEGRVEDQTVESR